MNLDSILTGQPLIGFFFERTYGFWRTHIALANITHFVFGLGVGLLVFTEWRKAGFLLILFGVLVHVVAFLN